ncbi:hypothetical protein NPA07_01020 [Mycoplasmopsis caviae]|uniref:DUF3137 domain-containing protein n=1 Tax=Mycoplasmopsis caviae TaxID=55603 RepID=A0A3P8LHX6_9BACT|nr:hypothetical protein [Mycoplasmopsis caviae]UUD35441.1 hypothetical protein NPA07_01020 [Mycoplasmopsis caviae]VDR41782.1 Uncharacterised protein [Mycoplasmopsis caviae]
MGVTTKPKEYKEFYEENVAYIRKMVTKHVNHEAKSNRDITIKFWVQLFFGIFSLLVGLTFLALLIGFWIKGFIYISPVQKFFWFIGAVLIAGFGCFLCVWAKENSDFIRANFRQSINNEKFYEKALERLSIKVIDVNDANNDHLIEKFDMNYDDNLECLSWAHSLPATSWIPYDATVYTAGKIFLIMDKYNNPWAFQNIKYSYTKKIRNLSGEEDTKDFFEYATIFEGILLSSPKTKDFTLALGERCGLSSHMHSNVDFEDKQFAKIMRPHTDGELDIYNIYQPYAMEVTREHWEQYKKHSKWFGTLLEKQNVKAWIRPSGNIFEYNNSNMFKSKKDKIESVTREVLSDAYSVYWVLSFIQIPGYFK